AGISIDDILAGKEVPIKFESRYPAQGHDYKLSPEEVKKNDKRAAALQDGLRTAVTDMSRTCSVRSSARRSCGSRTRSGRLEKLLQLLPLEESKPLQMAASNLLMQRLLKAELA
ncbi:unnamed protein product, partial [Prorocentrum cordatum]